MGEGGREGGIHEERPMWPHIGDVEANIAIGG